MLDIDKVLEATHPAQPRLSPRAWIRYTNACRKHLAASRQSLVRASVGNDRPELIRAGFELALYAVLSGSKIKGGGDAGDGMHERANSMMVLDDSAPVMEMDMLRNIGVLEQWEDELWLELRGLYR